MPLFCTSQTDRRNRFNSGLQFSLFLTGSSLSKLSSLSTRPNPAAEPWRKRRAPMAAAAADILAIEKWTNSAVLDFVPETAVDSQGSSHYLFSTGDATSSSSSSSLWSVSCSTELLERRYIRDTLLVVAVAGSTLVSCRGCPCSDTIMRPFSSIVHSTFDVQNL
jgi:hypothetical protein